ncbi:MAG: chitobiase/beta-hexosaminidase C-terminal domain-containing protein [Clostridiales Family XIII bacterium]|nr:chitobiase/beta-hexosaminidase C-terminal domain-containing protein [Clostridiales Family XIII bacterium]
MSEDREGPRKYSSGYFGDSVYNGPGAKNPDADGAADDSVLYDEATGRTYYLDEETGAYYYYDKESGDYVYYEGDDGADGGPPETSDAERPYGNGGYGEADERAVSGINASPERAQARPERMQTRPDRGIPREDADMPAEPWEREMPRREDPRPRTAAQTKPSVKKKGKNRTTVILIIVAAVLLIGAVIASVLIFGAKDKNTYDAQMRIGVEHYKAGEYDEAEEAFLKALEFKPGDVNASVALADTYSAQKKYDRAASLLEDTKLKHPEDADIMNRLLTLYISDLSNIERANELIIECYEGKIDPKNDLVMPAPVFDPAGGSFEEAKQVEITATEGYAIYYTQDGTMPTTKSSAYKSALKIAKSSDLTITAVGVAENGLMTWPGTAEFKIDIRFVTDKSAIDLIGSSAKTIMNSVGALYYKGVEGGGLYYQAKNNDGVSYIFTYEDLDVPEPDPAAEDDKAAEPDPEKHPLKENAKCVAVDMRIDEYTTQLSGNIAVEDLMSGLSIKNYKVTKSEMDDKYHLYYTQNGLSFDYTLKDKETASGGGTLLVK